MSLSPTQVEVVVLCVAESNEDANDVDKRCSQQSALSLTAESRFPLEHVRFAEAFLPKYAFWYRAKRPFACGSGAGPRGSFS